VLFFIDESVQKNNETGEGVAVLTAVAITEEKIREIERELFNLNKQFWKVKDPLDFEIKGRFLLNRRKVNQPKNVAYAEQIIYLSKNYDLKWAATFKKERGVQTNGL